MRRSVAISTSAPASVGAGAGVGPPQSENAAVVAKASDAVESVTIANHAPRFITPLDYWQPQ